MYAGVKLLVIGCYVVTYNHFIVALRRRGKQITDGTFSTWGADLPGTVTPNDIALTDAQNFRSAVRASSEGSVKLLEKHQTKVKVQGTIAALLVLRYLCVIFFGVTTTLSTRVYMAGYVSCFLTTWRLLEQNRPDGDLKTSFFPQPTCQHAVFAVQTAVLSIMVARDHWPSAEWGGRHHGSDSVEQLFSGLLGNGKVKMGRVKCLDFLGCIWAVARMNALRIIEALGVQIPHRNPTKAEHRPEFHEGKVTGDNPKANLRDCPGDAGIRSQWNAGQDAARATLSGLHSKTVIGPAGNPTYVTVEQWLNPLDDDKWIGDVGKAPSKKTAAAAAAAAATIASQTTAVGVCTRLLRPDEVLPIGARVLIESAKGCKHRGSVTQRVPVAGADHHGVLLDGTTDTTVRSPSELLLIISKVSEGAGDLDETDDADAIDESEVGGANGPTDLGAAEAPADKVAAEANQVADLVLEVQSAVADGIAAAGHQPVTDPTRKVRQTEMLIEDGGQVRVTSIASAVKLVHEAFLVHRQETGSAQLPRDRLLRMAVTAAAQAASVKRAVDFTDATAASSSNINLGDALVMVFVSSTGNGQTETFIGNVEKMFVSSGKTEKNATDAIPLESSSDGFRVVYTHHKLTKAGKGTQPSIRELGGDKGADIDHKRHDKTCFVALADMVHGESTGTSSHGTEQRSRHVQLAGQLKPASKAKAKATKKRKLVTQSKNESYGPGDFGPSYTQRNRTNKK